jgi:PAS domain-containing protein
MSKTDDARQALTGDLAAIVESSQDAIFRKTLDGVIESWNAGAQSIYGSPAGSASSISPRSA